MIHFLLVVMNSVVSINSLSVVRKWKWKRKKFECTLLELLLPSGTKIITRKSEDKINNDQTMKIS